MTTTTTPGTVTFRDATTRQPGWVWPAFVTLLLATGFLYLWGLGASGTANSFYAAAVQAGSTSWKALFFGSLDAGNFITVDKPPAALWVMGLSARLFGFNAWSMLVPQALEGVAAVGLLYGAVRRWSGPVAGLAAGAALALTPAAALIFRFNNPDALLVLLMVAGAYCVVRAVERASTRWLLLAGVAIGFAFLTKMLQGVLVLPAFGAVYLIAAPTSLRRRLTQLVAAAVAVVVSAGWWIAAVQLWPASSRPYIGGSTNNTVMDLVLGYNGFGRLLGGSGNAGGGGGMGGSAAATGSSFGGATGIGRLFGSEMGNEISWLLPAALVGLVGGLWFTRRAPRTDRTRAALVLWGGWLLVTGVVFSSMQGTIHPYYTVALAPAIAGLVAIGGQELWQHRAGLTGRLGTAAMVAAAGGWSVVLLGRNPGWLPPLRWIVLSVTVAVCLALLVPLRALARPARRRAAGTLLLAGVLAGLSGTAAYAAATAASPHSGSIPSVGPASAAAAGDGMGGGMGAPAGGQGGAPGGTPPQGGQQPPGMSSATSEGAASEGSVVGSGGGGGGGQGVASSSELTTLLAATTSRWSAAVVGDQSAAELELSSETAVMAMGGWSGSDPAPTLAQFEQYVSSGQVRYFIAGGGAGGSGQGSGTTAQITAWVTSHFTATTVGTQTVYDLTSAS
jgi:4-amino-4-deoxy-L-arabinose transferase-like glycosyltransferase